MWQGQKICTETSTHAALGHYSASSQSPLAPTKTSKQRHVRKPMFASKTARFAKPGRTTQSPSISGLPTAGAHRACHMAPCQRHPIHRDRHGLRSGPAWRRQTPSPTQTTHHPQAATSRVARTSHTASLQNRRNSQLTQRARFVGGGGIRSAITSSRTAVTTAPTRRRSAPVISTSSAVRNGI